MYLVKICKGQSILDVLHYQRFKNVVADIADKSIFRELVLPVDILVEIN